MGAFAMAHNSTYQLRLDDDLKQKSFSVFHELGMTPAEGMRIFLTMVAKTKSIPFAVNIQNEESKNDVLNFFSIQEKRKSAVIAYANYIKKVRDKINPAVNNLTDEDINRLVHELR